MNKLLFFPIFFLLLTTITVNANPTLFYTTANANVNLPNGYIFTNDFICGSLTIDSGNSVYTNGFNIYCANTVKIAGTIKTNTLDFVSSTNGGAGGHSTSNCPNGQPGTGNSLSFGGSGGGGGGDGGCGTGGSGGSTTVAGGGQSTAGSTGSTPVLSNANIITWYTAGFTGYLQGAGGGGGTTDGVNGQTGGGGGAGGMGIFIEASNIAITGTIQAVGESGGAGTSSSPYCGNGGGGAGGGTIILAYGSGGYTAGTYSVGGGGGGSKGNANCIDGALGGSGQAQTFNFVSAPINVFSLLSSVTITNPSNSIVDVGQTESFTMNVIGGATPYVENIFVANSISHSVISAFNSIASTSSTSSTFAFTVNTAMIGNSPLVANAFVTDNSPSTVNSVFSSSFTVNPQLFSTGWTATNSVAHYNGYQTLSASISGGTTSYTYNFLVYNAVGSLVSNLLISGSSLTSNTYSFQINPSWGTGLFTANVLVTDSASTPVTVSNTLTFNVDTVSSVTLTNPSNAIIDLGQSASFTASWIGGQNNFQANLIIVNAINNAQISNQLTTAISGQNTLITYTPATIHPSSTPLKFNVIITDANGNVANSVYTTNLIVNSAFSLTSFSSSPSIPVNTETGQILTFNAVVSGGSSSYTYNFIVSNILTNSVVGNLLVVTSNTAQGWSFTIPSSVGTNSLQANVVVTDSASTPVTVNSIYLRPINTIPGIIQNLFFSNSGGNSIVYGTVAIANSIVSSGSPPYSWQWKIDGNLINFQSLSSTQTSNTILLNGGTHIYNSLVTDNEGFSILTQNTLVISTNTLSLNLNLPNSFTYNGNGGTVTAQVSTIGNQITGTLWENGANILTTNNIATFTTSRNAGTYSFVFNSLTNGNYTSASSSGSFTISPSNSPTLTETLNGTAGNYVIYQHQTIPINVVSTTSNIIILYRNGVSVASTNGFSLSYSDTENSIGTVTFEAVANSINYTTTTQTWILSVNEPAFTTSLISSNTYLSYDGNTLLPSNNIFNLLNFKYFLNTSSFYKINSIQINFGSNSLPSNQLLVPANYVPSNDPVIYNSVLFNTYGNNAINSYNAIITINDIYGDLLTKTIVINTNTYVYPTITPPNIILNNAFSTYSYTTVHTPISVNVVQGSFPINVINVYPGEANAIIEVMGTGTNTVTVTYSYPSITNSLQINALVVDLNNFNSLSTTSNDMIFAYNPGSVTLQTSPGYASVNQEYSFTATAGQFAMKSVNVYWGDGDNTTYTFPTPLTTSGNFILRHDYIIPQTYSLTVFSTDNSFGGAYISSTLTNPSLVVDAYNPPAVTSVTPNTRFNGANDNSELFTFTIQSGSFPTSNITVNWNDARTVGSNSTHTFNTLSSNQLTFAIRHTFQFPISYPVNAMVCDQFTCVTYATPISIGPIPLTQSDLNKIQNDTGRSNNQSQLDNNPSVQNAQNPTPPVVAIILFIGFAMLIGILAIKEISKNERNKKK